MEALGLGLTVEQGGDGGNAADGTAEIAAPKAELITGGKRGQRRNGEVHCTVDRSGKKQYGGDIFPKPMGRFFAFLHRTPRFVRVLP